MYAYAIADELRFHFEEKPFLPKLIRKLHLSNIGAPSKDSILIFCRKKDLSAEPWHFYKGVPWKAIVKRTSDGKISEIGFYAPFFKEFLFFRIVLLPLLWRLAVEKGGFYLLGTAYQDLFGTTILFAAPGAGKTRYALAKLQAPNHFLIGDGSLLYLPDKGIVPVVDELELRFRTISGSIWMKELAMTGKIRLFLYHMISILTRKYVSFNLTLPPEELKIKVRHDSPETIHRFALVHSFDHIQELLFRDVEPTVMEYLRQYHNHYWNIFNDTPPLDATRKNILKFCTRYL